MRRMLATVLAAALLAVVVGSSAQAQDDAAAMKWGANIGLYMPLDDDATDAVGDNWWSFGISMDLAPTETALHRVGLGWIQAPGETIAGTDVDLRMIPITYTYLRSTTGFARGLYYGAGAGVYLAKAEASGGGLPDDDESETKFGVHLLGGYSFTDRLSAELRYTKVFGEFIEGSDINLDGVSLSLVGRF